MVGLKIVCDMKFVIHFPANEFKDMFLELTAEAYSTNMVAMV